MFFGFCIMYLVECSVKHSLVMVIGFNCDLSRANWSTFQEFGQSEEEKLSVFLQGLLN